MAAADVPAIAKLFNNAELLDHSGRKSAARDLAAATAVGIYFSAHWCGPCRGFTPKLAEAYSKHLHEKGMEIVFVSSDKDQASFDSYFKEMPWKALPFDQRELKAALSKKFKVSGIPTLVILDPNTGKVITEDGREAVMNDMTGAKFPWHPPTFAQTIGHDFINHKGDKVSFDSLKQGPIGIYFSAHWCPPCRQFTPRLIATYKALKAANKAFEVIFVSGDNSKAEFTEYFHEMPWLAVPFEDDERKNALNSLYKVEGIPTFVMVDPRTGEVINSKARNAVMEDPDGKSFPWKAQPAAGLSPSTAGDMQENASLVVFVGDKVSDDLKQTLLQIGAEQLEQARITETDALRVFWATDSPITERVRELMGAAKDVSVMGIIDIPSTESSFLSNISKVSDVSAASIRQFVKDYQDGKIKPKPLQA